MAEIQDIYLANPPRQPKRNIADHLEQMGVLVPRRFETFEEAVDAVRNDCQIIIRSEHPQDYAGVSDIMNSVMLGKTDLELSEILTNRPRSNTNERFLLILNKRLKGELSEAQFWIELVKLNDYYIEMYCELMNQKPDDFYKDISFSYWERLGGYNRSIVADSSIKGRYHLFTDHSKGTSSNYSIIDQGKIDFSTGAILAQDLRDRVAGVIEFYEQVRHADGFDPNHCPIVEFQTFENHHYFLQYHRTRDFSPSEWRLERDPEAGEEEVYFVRGATSPDGIVLETTLYGDESLLMEREDASFDLHYNFIFTDIMSRRRRANFGTDFLNVSPEKRHSFKSKAFKAECYAVIQRSEVFKSILRKAQKELISSEDLKLARKTTPIRLVSDGRRAFVKF